MRQIYLASSWRNLRQPNLVEKLRQWGHKVYDFRNPVRLEVGKGFAWSDLDPDWQKWSARDYRKKLLESQVASHGFVADLRAMHWADTCVLLQPCGRSAHLELGYMAGQGKHTIIVLSDGEEPELMAMLADQLVVSEDELQAALQ